MVCHLPRRPPGSQRCAWSSISMNSLPASSLPCAMKEQQMNPAKIEATNALAWAQTRRHFLTSAGYGLGLAALGQLLAEDRPAFAASTSTDPLTPRPTHFPARAKACIFIFLERAPSQIDLWDPKPMLNELHGKPLPQSLTKDVRFAFIKKETALLQGSNRRFSRHGASDMQFSDLTPHLAECADEMLMIR